MTVQFTVFSLDRKWTSHSKSFGIVPVYTEVLWSSGEDNIRDHGFPNASVALTSEWLSGSAGTLRNENSATSDFCLMRDLRKIQFRLVMFQDPTALMSLMWVLSKRYFAADNDAPPIDVLVTLWIIVKDCVGTQILGTRLMMGHLLISENMIEFAAHSITSTHIIHGYNANCREEKQGDLQSPLGQLLCCTNSIGSNGVVCSSTTSGSVDIGLLD